MNQSTINTAKFSAASAHRRESGPPSENAVTRFGGSEQEQDLSNPANCRVAGDASIISSDSTEGRWLAGIILCQLDPAANALGMQMPNMLEAQVFQNASAAGVVGIASWTIASFRAT